MQITCDSSLFSPEDRCVTIETWEQIFFFLKKYDEVSCMHLGHTRRVNSLSPEVVKLSLSVIVVENGMRCDERTGALALIPGYLQVPPTSSSARF